MRTGSVLFGLLATSTAVMGKMKYLVWHLLGSPTILIHQRTNEVNQGIAMAGIDFGCDIDVS